MMEERESRTYRDVYFDVRTSFPEAMLTVSRLGLSFFADDGSQVFRRAPEWQFRCIILNADGLGGEDLGSIFLPYRSMRQPISIGVCNVYGYQAHRYLAAGADEVFTLTDDPRSDLNQRERQRMADWIASLFDGRAKPNQARDLLHERISDAADRLRELRINSIADVIADLDSLAEELAKAEKQDWRDVLRALPILGNIYEVMDTKRAAGLIVAGAAAAILGQGNPVSTTAIYTVTFAALQGKKLFLEAVRALGKPES